MTFSLVAVGCLLVALASGCSSSGTPAATPSPPSAILPDAPSGSTTPLPPGKLPEGSKRYEDAAAGFSMGYPGEWTPQEDVGGTLVGFVAPAGDASGTGFVDNANVTQESVGATTLDQYNASARSQIQAAFPNAVFETDGGTTLGGEPAYAYQYTSEQNGESVRVLQVFAVHDQTLTALTFAASVPRWPALEPDFRSMLGSFRFQ